MSKLSDARESEDHYISAYQKHNEHLEDVFSFDKHEQFEQVDKAWTAKNPEN